MSDVPVQLIVAAFQDEKSADEALKLLKQAKRERLIGIVDAAVLRKDAKGKLHIKETADMGGGKGAALGGVAGAAIGLIAGPALIVPAAVGALIGGLAAKLRDSGFPQERLKMIGDGLKPGTSAIVAVVVLYLVGGAGVGLFVLLRGRRMAKKWYEVLFTDYAETHDRETFTQGTLGECDFIESEIGGDRSVPILDIGCGTGRHAIELARRGYTVTGIDLSPSQIWRASVKAEAAGISPDFRVGDARALPFREEFGLAVMICEGAIPLMETDEMNFAILRGAARALRPGGNSS